MCAKQIDLNISYNSCFEPGWVEYLALLAFHNPLIKMIEWRLFEVNPANSNLFAGLIVSQTQNEKVMKSK